MEDVASDEPVAMVRLPVAVSWLSWLIVPETATVAKDWDPAIRMVRAAPVNVRVLAVEEKAPEVTEEVSQLPAMVIVADPNSVFAAVPDEVKFPLKVGVELVKVRVPDHVRFEATVVATDAFTVKLNRTWGMLIVPPESPTMIVEVPTANVAPAAEVFMDPIVIEELPAESVPVAATVRFEPPVMLLFEVVSVPVMLSVFVTSIALFWAIVPLTVRR